MSNDKLDKIEIAETLRKQAAGLICLNIFVIILMIISTIAIFGIAGSEIGSIAGIFIWLIIVGLFYCSYSYVRGSGEIRKFIIRNDYISVERSGYTVFTVNLSDFNEIEVQNKVPPIKYIFHGVTSGGDK